MSHLDPYACGPKCGCDKCDPCDEEKPLEIIITVGPPQAEPDHCTQLPIAYDADNGCFYLWTEQSGWFEATGIEWEVEHDDNGFDHRLRLTHCGEDTFFINSKNTALEIDVRNVTEENPFGNPWLIIRQTQGPNLEVNLSALDSWVTTFALIPPASPGAPYQLRLNQNRGRPNYLVPLPFVTGDDLGPQTQVRNTGPGTVGQRTYVADHFGTYPNVTWRETWMERDGDIVTIHSWNPETNSWDAVAIEAPENLVILNNPVIYLRPGGSANPPINSQADLTEANAFNSMNAIRSFMNRTYVFGSVTIDGRGQMNGGNIGPAQFKNAQNIVVRGDPANAASFSFESANTGGAAVSVTGGTVTFQDMTFRVRDEAVVPGRFGVVGNTRGGVAILRGNIRFVGTYDTDRPQSAPAYLITAAGTSRSRIESGTSIVTNFDPGTSFNALFTAFEGGTLDIGNNLTIQHNTSFEVTNIIYIQAASYFLAHMGNGVPPVVTGQDVVTSGPSVRCANLSSTVASNWGVNMAGFFEWDWGQDSGVGQLAELGVYGGDAGPWP